MNILFIHQNFPGQYKHLAPELARMGHKCVALTLRVKKPTDWKGVKILPYKIDRQQGGGVHPWLLDMDTKVIRGEACFLAARQLRDKGFVPDVIVAHPGWGEALFLRDVWPSARIGLYYEWYYGANEAGNSFDPEFAAADAELDRMRLRIKNVNNLLNSPVADMALSPTQYQASRFPEHMRDKITVIHDGIDTGAVRPDASATLTLPDGTILTQQDEVVSFLNRNLEPFRGYHRFMRALPRLLKERPNARVVIVGADGTSYGAAAPKGQTWKQIYIDEVRAQIPDSDWERVHFVGTLPYDAFLNLLQVTRAHIYLTYPFVLSWSLIEAMSAGTPILASDTAPVREVIKQGQTGMLVDFFDADGMVDQLVNMLDDAPLRQRLGRAARAHVVTHYDLKTVSLPRMLEWIETLAAMEPSALPE
jgi:glycosyltransferase involved in cell wall biosynthesis